MRRRLRDAGCPPRGLGRRRRRSSIAEVFYNIPGMKGGFRRKRDASLCERFATGFASFLLVFVIGGQDRLDGRNESRLQACQCDKAAHALTINEPFGGCQCSLSEQAAPAHRCLQVQCSCCACAAMFSLVTRLGQQMMMMRRGHQQYSLSQHRPPLLVVVQYRFVAPSVCVLRFQALERHKPERVVVYPHLG
jgi:hypothetical protein